jgi:hypothetical protein
VARAFLVFRILPIPIGWKYVDRSVFREMANYSGVTFAIQVAYKLRFKTDVMVIGTLLSSTAITQFSIGSRMRRALTASMESTRSAVLRE